MATYRQLLESALTSTGVSGLIPKEIRATLVEQSRVINPLWSCIPRVKTDRTQHFWVRRNGLPQGGATNQAPPFSGIGSVPESSSNYVNNNVVNIRFLTWRGNVGKIAEQVATVTGSIMGHEMEGQAEALARTESVFNLYGHESGTLNSNKTQWTGMDGQIALTNKFTTKAISGVANDVLALKYLDAMYDFLRSRMGLTTLGGKFMFVMTPEAQTVINNLFFQANRVMLPLKEMQPASVDPDIFGSKDAEFMAARLRAMVGLEVASYRGVPIVVSSFLTPYQPTATWTITGTNSTVAASNFTDNTTVYKYMIEAVTIAGKSVASSEVSVTAALATNQIRLSWTAPVILDPNGFTLPILHYRIFRAGVNGVSGIAGAETLYAVIPSIDTQDAAVAQFFDDNNNHDPLSDFNNNIALQPQTAAGFGWVGLKNASDGVTLPTTLINSTPVQDVFLWPIDPDISVMAVLNEVNQQVLSPITSRSWQFETRADMALTIYSNMFAAQLSGVALH